MVGVQHISGPFGELISIQLVGFGVEPFSIYLHEKKKVTMHPFVVLSLRSFFSLGIRVPETFFKLGLHVDLSKPRPGNLPSSARAWKNGTYGWSLFFHPKWRSPKTHVRYPKITCYFSDLFQLQKLNRYKNPLHFKTPLRKCSTLSPHVCVLCFAHPNIPIPIAEIRIPTYPKIVLLPPQRPKISPEKNDDWKMIYLYIYIYTYEYIYSFFMYFQLKHEPLF